MYAFDLLELQSRDVREQPLMLRRARLAELLIRADSRVIRFSESFPDAEALLEECARRGLEGIVSKRKDSQYRSGLRSGWLKVKTQVSKDANKDRWLLVPSVAQAEKRIALLIGNKDYKPGVGTLADP